MKHCMDIKNDVQRNATAMRLVGSSNEQINRVVADIISDRGPIGTGKYACTCNNWGPRWIENSLDGCCPGCFAMALDIHQEMDVNGVEPPTREMIENNTWGINVAQLDKNRANRLIDKALAEDFTELPEFDRYPVEGRTSTWDWAAGNDPEDFKGMPVLERDPDVPSFYHNLDWVPEDK